MDKIKKSRVVFCRYLSSLVNEKNFTIEDIVKFTNRSYTEVKRILEGLIDPTLEELLLIADMLNLHITLSRELPFDHKKIGQTIPLVSDMPDMKNQSNSGN